MRLSSTHASLHANHSYIQKPLGNPVNCSSRETNMLIHATLQTKKTLDPGAHIADKAMGRQVCETREKLSATDRFKL